MQHNGAGGPAAGRWHGDAINARAVEELLVRSAHDGACKLRTCSRHSTEL